MSYTLLVYLERGKIINKCIEKIQEGGGDAGADDFHRITFLTYPDKSLIFENGFIKNWDDIEYIEKMNLNLYNK